MNKIDILLFKLKVLGVLIEATANNLRIDAPQGVITPEILESLKESKVDILNLLSTKNNLPANNYLQVDDLNGEDQIFTIERVVHHKFDGEVIPVIKFHEVSKGLILDKVNLDAIVEKYGVDPDNWIGERIQAHENEQESEIRVLPSCQCCGNWNGYMDGGHCGVCYLKLGLHRKTWENREIRPGG